MCPFGEPGDRLWVRETWAKVNVAQFTGSPQFVYPVCDTLTDYGGPWKPSIHMPRAASRISLEITAVRVERLADISDEDAIAEGVDPSAVESFRRSGADRPAAHAFRASWGSVYGPESWEADPWVWVVEFKRVEVPHV